MPPAHFDAQSEWIVSEIDESDRTIDYFSPEMTIALNVGSDHLTNYGSIEAIQHSFGELFRRTKQCIFFPEKDSILIALAKQSSIPYVACDTAHLPYSQEFQELFQGFQRTDYDLIAEAFYRLTGNFPSLESFCNFAGIFQRNNLLASIEDHLFFCDHAHHPNEICASIQYFHLRYPTHTLCAIFRPHRFSRVQQYASEFADALSQAERILFVPTDPADEVPTAEGKCECIAQHVAKNISYEIASAISEIPNIVEQWITHAKKPFCYIYLTVGSSIFLESLPEIQSRIFLKELKNKPYLENIPIYENEPIGTKTTFKVGGSARILARPQDERQLQELLQLSKRYNISIFFLGNGSNLLWEDKGFQGLVISLNHAAFRDFHVEKSTQVRVGAGMLLRTFCHHLASHSLGGIEALSAIPATVGGMLAMNGGACGILLSNYLLHIEVIDQDGHKRCIPKEEINWQYRKGFCHSKACILSAFFEFPPTDPEESRQLQRQFSQQRLERQPLRPNAGSIFQNPDVGTLKAWELIDRCGLRGFCIGDAEISTQHTNFIMNRGHASSQDVRQLIDHARYKVFEHFQIFLEREILQIPGDIL
ncbi:MAG: UDP-N-acetylmuramate dehydrogenase, partial [Puniceicoccales bacterium]|jgi:UDP-N-acetylenolpyruvoylglucosamine reductase|nr:UDP-N-acetylmuramate dehydrogenase [Puniceicoccales bacterium]